MLIQYCVFVNNDDPHINVHAETGVLINTIQECDFEDHIFLCKSGDNVFVSTINYDDYFGYYVDDIKRKQVVSIGDIDEIHLIQLK